MNGSGEERNWLTIADAAARCGVHPRTLRRRIADGSLTAYRFGPQSIRLDSADLDTLLRPIPTADKPSKAASPPLPKPSVYVGRHERPE